MTPKKDSIADRAFRALLHLFPSEFRGDYGSEMEGVFRAQQRESRGGVFGLLRLWAETIAGIFRTAPAEHVEMFRQDGAFALRMMRKNVSFTALVVFILALGIGANTAIFSIIDGVLLRPLPYTDGSRLVNLYQEAPKAGFDDIGFSVHEINDYREQSRTIDSIVEYHNMQFDLLGVGEPQRINTGVVSANFFDVLGVKPIAGRTFLPDDEKPGAPAVLVFSYEYWKRVYSGDLSVVGRTFRMNDKVHTVVGILPPMPQYPDENDVYMPTSACPFRSRPQFIANRTARMMTVFGRLKPNVTLEQARGELAGIATQLQRTYPDAYPNDLGYAIRAESLKKELTEHARPTFLILLATAGLVLLIVCANVANLSLSRQLRREREMAVRAALGASRSRLLRQMVTEATMLSLLGGALGLLFAWGSLDLLVSFAARFTPRAHEISLDGGVLLFSLGVSLLAGVLFGSIPALSSPVNLAAPLKSGLGQGEGAGSRQRLRSVLVVAQVALSFTLLTGAGLMLRSFYKLTKVDPGFRPENVLSMLVQLNFTRYGGADGASKTDAFHHQLLDRVRRNPAVISAALGLTVPLNDALPWIVTFQIEGREHPPGEPQPRFEMRILTPGYFETLGIPLIRGRFFTDQDGPDSPQVVLINEAMRDHYWKNQDPIGQRVSTDGGKSWRTIVGVVGNVKQYGMDRPPADEYYRATDQAHIGNNLLVRTRGNPEVLIRQLVEDVHAIDPEQPVAKIRTLEQLRYASLAPPRLTSTLLALFAGLALVITAAGIAGVMGLAVTQRIKEIGIRMALGATRRSVMRMVLGQGVGLVIVGLVLGFAASMEITKLMSGMLFGIEPNDPLTLAGVAAVLLGAAVAACYGPAHRATTIDPMQALRME